SKDKLSDLSSYFVCRTCDPFVAVPGHAARGLVNENRSVLVHAAQDGPVRHDLRKPFRRRAFHSLNVPFRYPNDVAVNDSSGIKIEPELRNQRFALIQHWK